MPFQTNPAQAYFPLPLIDKLEDKFDQRNGIYHYCKTKLKELVTALKSRKDRNRFHFYFGESLELCITNEEWKNKFHVIYCPTKLIRYAGLPNTLPIVSQCLNSDMPEAVLLTDFFISQVFDKEKSITDSIESILCCPLTMIPTVYGVKLLDHVRLGSFVCSQLHDYFVSRGYFTLKWNKAPVSYSTDTQLGISPALTKVLKALAETCLINASGSVYSPQKKNKYRTMINNLSMFMRNTPLTFYYILHPLLIRSNLEAGAIDYFIGENYDGYELAWKTLQQWMNGEEVFLYYTTDEKMRDAIFSIKQPLTEMANVQFSLIEIENENRYRPGQTADEDFLRRSQGVYNLNWNVDEFAVSFLLAKNHRLSSSTQFFICNGDESKILYSTSLRSKTMQRKVVTNPNPRRLTNPQYKPLSVFRCQESEEDYQVVVVSRRIKIRSLQGIFNLLFYL